MIDEVDRKLIRELQKNGRQSSTELSKILGVVEGTVRRRTKRLIQNDIMKVVAIPNMDALGYSFMSIVGVQVHMGKLNSVAETLSKMSHVCRVVSLIGRYDLMTIIFARSAEEFSDFMRYEIFRIPGVVKAETLVGLHSLKGEWELLDTTEIIDKLEIPSEKRLP